MRWEDERYIRFYTRDTPEFLAMTWHARGLFGLIMRKVDRAGILKVGKLALRGVAVAVGGPWVEVESPLRELLDDGCVVFDEANGVVAVRNFLDAQEAVQSDKARKRASRERAIAKYGTSGTTAEMLRRMEREETVTNRDDIESQPVTGSHVESHAVTSGHSVPGRAVPNHAEVNSAGAPDVGGSKGKRGTRLPDGWTPARDKKLAEVMRKTQTGEPQLLAVLEEFRDFWISVAGSKGCKLDWDATFRNRLREVAGRQKQRQSGRYPPPAANTGITYPEFTYEPGELPSERRGGLKKLGGT